MVIEDRKIESAREGFWEEEAYYVLPRLNEIMDLENAFYKALYIGWLEPFTIGKHVITIPLN